MSSALRHAHAAPPGRPRRVARAYLHPVRAVARLAAAAVSVAALSALATATVWSVVPLLAGWDASVVMSGSMCPALAPGDLVLTAPIGDGGPQVGQVVRFVAGDGRVLVHRVQSVGTDGTLVTRGDANPSADAAPVPPDRVLALARLRVPWIGLPVLWWWDRRWAPLALTATLAALSVWAAGVDAGARHRAAGPASRRARRRTPQQAPTFTLTRADVQAPT